MRTTYGRLLPFGRPEQCVVIAIKELLAPNPLPRGATISHFDQVATRIISGYFIA